MLVLLHNQGVADEPRPLKREGSRHGHRRSRAAVRSPPGRARPSSTSLLFPSDLRPQLGLGVAVAGPATAYSPDLCAHCRTNYLSLCRASYHLGKARGASLVAQLCALASWRAMVPGDPDRRSGSDVFVFCGRTRGPCRFCRSRLELHTFLPGNICLQRLPCWRSAAGGRWVAWFRATPFATPTRAFGGNPHPWGALGLVAPARLPALLLCWVVVANRTRCYFSQHRHYSCRVLNRPNRLF